MESLEKIMHDMVVYDPARDRSRPHSEFKSKQKVFVDRNRVHTTKKNKVLYNQYVSVSPSKASTIETSGAISKLRRSYATNNKLLALPDPSHELIRTQFNSCLKSSLDANVQRSIMYNTLSRKAKLR